MNSDLRAWQRHYRASLWSHHCNHTGGIFHLTESIARADAALSKVPA